MILKWKKIKMEENITLYKLYKPMAMRTSKVPKSNLRKTNFFPFLISVQTFMQLTLEQDFVEVPV